jgi:hypothetical protein
LDRRLSGPQGQSGSGGEEKNSKPLPGLEPLIIQSVAQRHTHIKNKSATAYSNVNFIYFTNAFFAILHLSFALMFMYLNTYKVFILHKIACITSHVEFKSRRIRH